MQNQRIILIDQSKVPKSQRRGEMILHKFPFRIGRKQTSDESPFREGLRENDLYLEESKKPFNASRNHVEIGFSGGSVYIRDLGSANGTLVNGMRMGGGHGATTTHILEKRENLIQLGKAKSPWMFELVVPRKEERYRMAVADDNADMRTLVRTIFEDDYDILEAVDGEQALDICLRESPDIAVLDWEMPKLGGVDVCKFIKTNLRTAGLPVIMLTGKKEVNDRISGILAGADDYIMKPPELEDLKTRVNAALSRSLHKRDVHWLTGIASEAAFREEVNTFLGNTTTKKEFELISIVLKNLGVLQAENGLSATDNLIQQTAESLWSETLKVERTVVGQLRLGHWGVLTPARNRRYLEKTVKATLRAIIGDLPVEAKIKVYSSAKCTNYYDFSGMI